VYTCLNAQPVWDGSSQQKQQQSVVGTCGTLQLEQQICLSAGSGNGGDSGGGGGGGGGSYSSAGMLKLLLALALGGGGEGCTIKCEEIWNEVQTAAEDAGAGKYPDNVPPPNGPTQLLNGNTYKAARDAVDLVNKGIRRRAGDELEMSWTA
jgi:hypothetical protein